jgi:hypothetical protein
VCVPERPVCQKRVYTPGLLTTWVTRRLTATLARASAVLLSTSNSRVIQVTSHRRDPDPPGLGTRHRPAMTAIMVGPAQAVRLDAFHVYNSLQKKCNVSTMVS